MRLKVINRQSAIFLPLFSYSPLAQVQKARPTDPLTGDGGAAQPALWREPTDSRIDEIMKRGR